MGFIIHFYIIFRTNLLTGGPTQIAIFFAYFSVSRKKNIKWSPNGMKPLGAWFLEQTWSKGLEVDVKQSMRRPWGCLPPWARPPPSWAPRGSTDLLLLPIYTYVPPNHRGAPRKPNSTTTTFCIREIPSWSRCRHSTGANPPWRASTSTPWPLRWCVSSLFQTFGSIVIR